MMSYSIEDVIAGETWTVLTVSKYDRRQLRYRVYQIQGQKYASLLEGQKVVQASPKAEVFASNLPRDIAMEEVMEFFSRVGDVVQLRILMDFSGFNRGQCFVSYAELRASREAICCLDRQCIRNDRIYVKMSLNNNKLIFKSIPEWMTEEMLTEVFQKYIGDGLQQVSLLPSREAYKKNICFCKYSDHYKAAMAHKKSWPYVRVDGVLLEVQWAIPDVDKYVRAKLVLLDNYLIDIRNIFHEIAARHLFLSNFPPDMTNKEFFNAIINRINVKTLIQFRLKSKHGFITFSDSKALRKGLRHLSTLQD